MCHLPIKRSGSYHISSSSDSLFGLSDHFWEGGNCCIFREKSQFGLRRPKKRKESVNTVLFWWKSFEPSKKGQSLFFLSLFFLFFWFCFAIFIFSSRAEEYFLPGCLSDKYFSIYQITVHTFLYQVKKKDDCNLSDDV